jgi:DNA-binding NarL/FixJ family response regulator
MAEANSLVSTADRSVGLKQNISNIVAGAAPAPQQPQQHALYMPRITTSRAAQGRRYMMKGRELSNLGLNGQQIKIAQRLCIAPQTVQTHRKNIMRKLNVNSASELTLYAVNTGLLQVKR